jgi:hypothetical protein
MGDLLPPLPVDDVSLDLYWTALHPGPEADRSSLYDLLHMMSQMAGSDPDVVAEVIDENVVVLRDPLYHPDDLITALIVEVRRLRLCRT